jgi:hypothetical protein
MKKAIVLIVLAVGGYFTYSYFFPTTDPVYSVYEAFSDEIAEEVGYVDYQKLGELVVEGSQAQDFVRALKEIEGQTWRYGWHTHKGTPSRSRRTVSAKETSKDGSQVTYEVVQDTAYVNKPPIRFFQTITLQKTDDGWKVNDFRLKVETAK